MGKGIAVNLGRSLALLLVAIGLTGCGSDETRVPGFTAFRKAIVQKLAGPVGPQRVPPLTRAALEAEGRPLLYAKLENRDAEAILVPLETNARAVTWATPDGITLSLQDGVVIATRGLGVDLMGATAPSAQVLAAAPEPLVRTYSWLDGADLISSEQVTCRYDSLGSQTLQIVERAYQTRHLRETCQSDKSSLAFQNDYWFELSGKIRQSRQWLGPKAGYLSLRHLIP